MGDGSRRGSKRGGGVPRAVVALIGAGGLSSADGGVVRSFSFCSFILLLSSRLFFFSCSFSSENPPRPSSCGADQSLLSDAASDGGREQHGERRVRAGLTGVTLIVASLWKGSVVAAKGRE